MADTPSLVVLCLDTTFSCSQEHQDRWAHVNQLLTQPIDGLDDDSCGIGLSLEEAGCVYTICAREMCTQLYGMHLSPRLIGLEAFHLLTWNNLWRHLRTRNLSYCPFQCTLSFANKKSAPSGGISMESRAS